MEIIQHSQMLIQDMEIRENVSEEIIRDIIPGNFS